MKKIRNWTGRHFDEPPDPAEQEAEEERRFEHDFRKAMVDIEMKLHEAKSEDNLLQQVIITACKFYRADWCGIIIGDSETGVWTSTAWYSEGKGWMAKTSFNEFEFFENYPRWVKGLCNCEAVIVPDCDALKETDPEEYTHYERLHAHNVMGVPFRKHPTGFLVVRNAARYKTIPDLLRMTTYILMSTYYLPELEEGRREVMDGDGSEETKRSVRINVFGVPEIRNGFGCLNAEQYKSEGAWKILVYLALRGRPASSREISSTLWSLEDPEADADRVRGRLYRLRQKVTKFTDPDRIIITTEKGYTINWSEPVETDAGRMDELLSLVNTEPDIHRQIAYLKEIQEIYKGPVYAEFSYESWLRPYDSYYSIEYLKATILLLEELAQLNDYSCIRKYAARALQKIPGNVDIYYWLILSEEHMGAKDAALKDDINAQRNLTEEEYQELIQRLNKK